MEIFIGSEKLKSRPVDVTGDLIELNGELHYRIKNYDQIRPFFISLTSDSDIWMFVSSKGGLSAGRINADQAIFPYYTDDQLTELSENTGSKTAFLVESKTKWFLWQPFSDKYQGLYHISRNLYKNSIGNRLVFEEVNSDLGLTYRYSWSNCRQFGIIKKSELINHSQETRIIQLLDGLENLMPPGISQNVQQTKSNLANAYKKCELRKKSGLGIYSLSSNIIDRPEPSEALRATTVWCAGLPKPLHLLSSSQVPKFFEGCTIKDELEKRGEPGAYLVNCEILLKPDSAIQWYFAADTQLNASDITSLETLITTQNDLTTILENAVLKSSENLLKIASRVDGVQLSGDRMGNIRHMANVLFNVMRGGFYANEYFIEKGDFLEFIKSRNKLIFEQNLVLWDTLPNQINISDLSEVVSKINNGSVERYAYEYLPITFSRRHGDPSRPWNRFNIDVLNKDGTWKKRYEGNWRDIFQNWEALCYSFPEFAENIITVFLNASTIDGYNPYRITNRGIEWEITDPDDPWSFIGYWGDHQIIYLLKLLEISKKFHPDVLLKFINKPFYTFANVPYRIKNYDEIVRNPYDTIRYDEREEKQIEARVKALGADGKLFFHQNEIVQGSLTEKLLLPLLTKLSNFVPGGGIWMNTQRPEWNDANNALVGFGLSMVTVYYLRRYLGFLIDFYDAAGLDNFEIGAELKNFLYNVHETLQQSSFQFHQELSDEDRKRITDSLGRAGERYRSLVYYEFSGKKCTLSRTEVLDFLRVSLEFINESIRLNKRSDELYHSYNLIEIKDSGYGIKHLYPMLEGQVAVLSSGYASPVDSLSLLDALRQSDLYRKDQNSYILYPDKQLPLFLDKSRIAPESVENSKLLSKLIAEQDDSIIMSDVNGDFYFHPSLCNANDLRNALKNLGGTKYESLIGEESDLVLTIYEQIFHHHLFTGRSGSFFGYEGLGSIYWHMNSKLLLAVQEIFLESLKQESDERLIDSLKSHYYEIKEGLGTHKTPENYGAFPIDPYSHTPAHKGAQQPGMTGQVKEDIISRIGELGVYVYDGRISINPSLLKSTEFIDSETDLSNFGLYGLLLSNFLIFTFCGTPIIYLKTSSMAKIIIVFKNGEQEEVEGLELSSEQSRKIFTRDKSIAYLQVFLPVVE